MINFYKHEKYSLILKKSINKNDVKYVDID